MAIKELTRLATVEKTLKVLIEKRCLQPEKILIIGVAGPVASGKSRFSKNLQGAIEAVLGLKVLHCPFDQWINFHNLSAPTYAGRFFLQEFVATLRSIDSAEQWMCPRYDLVRQGYRIDKMEPLMFDSLEVAWNERRFVKLNSTHKLPDIDGGRGIYFEPTTRRLFSLVTPMQNTVYLMDGTLVFHDRAVSYGIKIYVTSSWANRIARMIRRFNRREVFGDTSLLEEEYVGFLVQEARSCADEEIIAQIQDDMIICGSGVETVSNLLDLYYLKQRLSILNEQSHCYFLTLEETHAAIEKAIICFSAITDISTIQLLRTELEHLIESKHLLLIQDIDSIFKRLADALHYTTA